MTGRVHQSQIKALEKVSAEEKIDRSAALRKVLDIGLREYMKRRAVEEYRKERISIGKAAEEAGVSVAEFLKVLADEGIPIKVDVDSVRDSLKRDFGVQAE